MSEDTPDTQTLLARIAELERAVSALGSTDAHLRSTMESARGFVLYRLEKTTEAPFGSRVVFASPSIRDILGIDTPEDFSSWFRSIHSEDLPRVMAEERTVAAEARPFDQVMRIHHPALDEWRWVHAISYPVSDQAGAVTHFNGLITDVTASKQAELALAESENRYRTIFERAPLPLFEVDLSQSGDRIPGDDDTLPGSTPNVRFEAANQAAVALFDASTAEELMGRVEELRTEESRSMLREAVRQLASGQRHFSAETVYRTLTGRRIEVLLSMSIPTARDGMHRVIVSALDITENRRAQEALRLRNRAMESSVNAIIISEVTQRARPIIYVNPAFERITGYATGDVLGTDDRALFRAASEQVGLRGPGGAGLADREGEYVVRGARKDGAPFWGQVFVAPVRDERGRTTHHISIMNDVTAHKQFEADLFQQANYDALTGLPNRTLLVDRLQQSLLAARRTQGHVTVAFVDLDNFKYCNDSLGHEVGDRVLTAIAERLKLCLREGDTVARYGGDEFVLLMSTGPGQGDCEAILNRILGIVAETLTVMEHTLHMRASIGYSVFPRDGLDGPTLIRNADAAMYEVKEKGRNEVRAYSSLTGQRFSERLTLESSLNMALERDELFVLYQPQVCMHDGRVVGLEALVRWQHPDFGIVSPVKFIPLAEETGLIVQIGRRVLQLACRQMVAWQAEGLTGMRISVNVAAREFRTPGFVAGVARVLEESGLDPHWLDLEITESSIMPQQAELKPIIDALRAVGVEMSIDDFGTGHSSLSYLKRFPARRLKVDRTFVRDLSTDADDANIVQTVVNLGHNLGLDVLAEGVEETAQLEFLAASGCDEYQGYLASPPLEAAQVPVVIGRVAPHVLRREPTRQ